MPHRRPEQSSCRRVFPACVAAFTLLAPSVLVPVRAQPPVPADPPAVLEEAPLVQYRAYRRMHARNDKYGHEAWLEAWTEFDGRSFRYEIVRERGSEYVLNKVLRKVLAREQELIAEGGADRAELSPENYEFLEPASHGKGVRYVLLKPRRKDILLVDGRLVLNTAGTELLRVEGRLAKNPSFWTSLVNVIRDFARVNGVRVPIATESIAKIKLAGLSRMLVRYEYESINGKPVALAARPAMAAGRVSKERP